MANPSHLSGQVALVTGGSKGIGAAIAQALAAAGVSVASTSRSGSGPTAPNLIQIQADVRKPDDAERAVRAALALHEAVDCVIEATNLKAHHGRDKSEKSQGKVENLDELVSAMRGYTPDADDSMTPMTQFLAYASLEAGENQAGEWDDSVQLMTLHSAKGLEFPLVFMVGMEDGLFPHQRSVENEEGLAEERRLCYVGMTRAMQKLHLSHAEIRRLHGSENLCAPSRFLGEIAAEYLREVRPRTGVQQPVFRAGARPSVSASGPAGLTLGQRVAHKKFGEGVVMAFEGDGPRARIQVNFGGVGTKWLVAGYAKLQPVT